MDAHIEQIAKSLYFSCKQFDIGLFYGKMGRCLFFFDYSRVTELRRLRNWPENCWMK